MKFDAFIFDLDGTLLDTLPDLVLLTNEALEAEGYPVRTREEILSYVGNGLRTLVARALPEGSSDDEVHTVFAHWRKLSAAYESECTKPYADMIETLRQLKQRGIKLGVLSNKIDEDTQRVIEQFMPGIFDVVHGECAEFPRKPDPAGLMKTIDELGSVPARTIYVGDSPSDVEVAKRAGAFSVAVLWGYRTESDLRAVEPDVLIGAPADLLSELL